MTSSVLRRWPRSRTLSLEMKNLKLIAGIAAAIAAALVAFMENLGSILN